MAFLDIVKTEYVAGVYQGPLIAVTYRDGSEDWMTEEEIGDGSDLHEDGLRITGRLGNKVWILCRKTYDWAGPYESLQDARRQSGHPLALS